MQQFFRELVIGVVVGASYALCARGAVRSYRGSGLLNFARGSIGTSAAYIAFVDLADRGWSTWHAIGAAVLAAGLVSFLFQAIVLRALRGAAPLVRVIAPIGLLGFLQAVAITRYGRGRRGGR